LSVFILTHSLNLSITSKGKRSEALAMHDYKELSHIWAARMGSK
jgi:hypothetical protein